MTKAKFENQSHYAVHVGESEIFDTRFPGGQVVVPNNQHAYEFSAEQLELPIELAERRSNLPFRIQNQDYVHGVTVLRSTGRDGEDASGGIELLEVIVPSQKVIAAMRSYLGRHDNGMPVPNTSWACEFEDTSTALEFWDRHWKPSFHLEDLRRDASRFMSIQDEDGGRETSISSYELGLLRPWFQQRTIDAIIGEDFASDGAHPVRLRDRDVVAEEYTPGNVYKIPETEWHSAKVKGYRTATCLAALRQNTSFGILGPPREETVVQWDDGRLTTFRTDQAPDLLPSPLTVDDIRIRQKEDAKAGLAS